MSVVINGSAGVTVNSGAVLGITSGTTVASTSGTSIDFTSIPSWVKRITVMFNGVSTSGTSNLQVQIGDAGGIETTSYLSSSTALTASGLASITASTGFIFNTSQPTDTYNGQITINLLGSNTWVENGALAFTTTRFLFLSAGSKSLSDTLTQVRITTVNGTDTFDAGSINILYE